MWVRIEAVVSWVPDVARVKCDRTAACGRGPVRLPKELKMPWFCGPRTRGSPDGILLDAGRGKSSVGEVALVPFVKLGLEPVS